MELSIITSIWSISGMPLEEALRRAAAYGFRHVDIFARGHGDPRHLSQTSKRAIVDEVKRLGLQVSGMVALFPVNSASPVDELREENWSYLMQCMDWAQELGARKLTYICGEREPGLAPNEAWKHSVDFARRCAREAERRGLYLILEFEPSCAAVVPSPVRALSFIEQVGSEAFLCNVDTGHVNVLRAGIDELEPVLPYTIHVHLSDNLGMFDSHDELGAGTTPNVEFVQAIEQSGIDTRCARKGLGPAVAAIEVNLAMIPAAVRPDPDDIVRRSLAYIRRTMPELAHSLRG